MSIKGGGSIQNKNPKFHIHCLIEIYSKVCYMPTFTQKVGNLHCHK